MSEGRTHFNFYYKPAPGTDRLEIARIDYRPANGTVEKYKVHLRTNQLASAGIHVTGTDMLRDEVRKVMEPMVEKGTVVRISHSTAFCGTGAVPAKQTEEAAATGK